eukprot:TRINITY_DN1864_c0_g1_i14.p1 TRINITY_DN1864_c0_g1~~TRINITY_DN1864_c0_g1_i14.p1  ORF type:complete len:157 (+),score=28.86 TRINITY_DN1864_c0_g1_i14:54-524(+)
MMYLSMYDFFYFFFFFKQKTAYEMLRSLVGSEMCIRDRYQRRVRGTTRRPMGPTKRQPWPTSGPLGGIWTGNAGEGRAGEGRGSRPSLNLWSPRLWMPWVLLFSGCACGAAATGPDDQAQIVTIHGACATMVGLGSLLLIGMVMRGRGDACVRRSA